MVDEKQSLCYSSDTWSVRLFAERSDLFVILLLDQFNFGCEAATVGCVFWFWCITKDPSNGVCVLKKNIYSNFIIQKLNKSKYKVSIDQKSSDVHTNGNFFDNGSV